MGNGGRCVCSGAEEIVNDLREDNLLHLEAGERLWKLYCFREPGNATNLRHRIYTKRKADGRLALLTFAAHNPLNTGEDDEADKPRAVRSALAHVPDLSAADLDRLIAAMQSQSGRDACEELDLSRYGSLEEQWALLDEHQER